MPATITAQGATPAGVSGSGFWPLTTQNIAAAGTYLLPEGEYYATSTETASVQLQTASGSWTTLGAVGGYVYSDGSNVQILMGATAGVVTLAQFRGR